MIYAVIPWLFMQMPVHIELGGSRWESIGMT